MHRLGLFWFQQDIRLSDHPALTQACAECEQLILLYCAEPGWFSPGRYTSKRMGMQRWRFVSDSLQELSHQLQPHKQQLVLRFQSPVEAISQLISQYNIDAIYQSRQPGYYEARQWQQLQQRFPYLSFQNPDSNTLFTEQQLPFALSELPVSFSKFRKQVEQLPLAAAIAAPQHLPPAPTGVQSEPLPGYPSWLSALFSGGEYSGQQHLKRYFNSTLPGFYKEVRNALDGFDNSTKFSPWLATGCVSARQVVTALHGYEASHGRNESSYWIYFELLWREYFHWYSHCHGKALFLRQGIKQRAPLTSFYPQRFRAWCEGNTPYPLINACMRQLNQTGYLSNRGRQLVASCFVHELQLDWRYGAAWFEQQLIDYDVAINWGNWQYLAGVGADPRGHRQFNLEKQQQQYDPDGSYIRQWQGDSRVLALDNVDAADWPVLG